MAVSYLNDSVIVILLYPLRTKAGAGWKSAKEAVLSTHYLPRGDRDRSSQESSGTSGLLSHRMVNWEGRKAGGGRKRGSHGLGDGSGEGRRGGVKVTNSSSSWLHCKQVQQFT